MQKIKSHKTVEQIAKKHRLEVSFVKNQLEMGIPIEHEHTRDKDLATDIALQHLDEIPDYYTRLKKMEADAKKHHKKFKDVKENIKPGNLHRWFQDSESKDGKPGWVNVVTGGTCASDEPGEGVPKCVSSSKRASMTKAERLSAARRKKAADPGQQQKTGAAKPTYVSTDKPKKTFKEEWSNKYKKSIDCDNPKGFSQRAHCQGKKKKMNEESDRKGKGSGKKDACYHKVKARYDVWPSAYASGALVKCRQKGASNWGTKSEDCWDGYEQKGMKKKGKKIVPNCVAKEELSSALNYDWDTPIRERADRYCPKCQKLERRNECKYGPKYWDMFSVPAEIISGKKDYNVTMPHPGNFPESYDHEYSMARSEISTIISAAKRLKKKMSKGEGNIEAWVQSKITKAADYLDSAADYVDSGEMKEESESLILQDLNGNDFVEIIDVIKPNPIRVKKEQFSNWREELSEDWQSANRKDRTDGMSRETVKKYRQENPESKLQTAVTEKNPTGKDADRQNAFCRRMSGMKDKLTSKKTARDPDSRINKALRRWNCN